jgi:hypothetical protein
MCRQVLDLGDHAVHDFVVTLGNIHAEKLIYENGDAELWTTLCAIDNPPPLRVLHVDWAGSPKLKVTTESFYSTADYPEDAPVANHEGQLVTGITEDNLVPWCLRQPADEYYEIAIRWIDDPLNALTDGNPIPFCPVDVVPPQNPWGLVEPGYLTDEELEDWAIRGAINAGFVTFQYMRQLATGSVDPVPAYNECEKLAP